MAETTQITYPEPKIIRRLTLWAPDPGAPNERAQMTFAEKNGNLEILVWSRSPSEKGKAPIRGNLGLNQILAVCQQLEAVAKGEIKDFLLELKNSRKNPENPEGPKEVYVQGAVRVARTSEGFVVIGVFDQDTTRPRILFPLTFDQWTGMMKVNGEPLDQQTVSSIVAKNYARILREVFLSNIEMTTNAEHSLRYGATNNNAKKPQQNKSNKPAFNNDGFDDISF